ncbi:MAG TPA: hypothetical protein VNZ22_04065, partial [Bacillota bacterium]|nr:hypothetical protein [Bacillota bacterium]
LRLISSRAQRCRLLEIPRSTPLQQHSSPYRRLAAALLLPLMLAITGCHSIGPHTVARDRFDYSASLSESWKRQTLLNIVKLRYLDPPIFVDVGQIVSGYQLQTSGNLGGQLSSQNAIQGNTLSLGGSATFIDRPTVTYVPLTGNKFIRGLMTPLAPESVFFTIQSGWPADAVLFATVASINGLKNQESSIAGVTPPDPGFLRVLALIRQIQLSGAVAIRVKLDAPNQQTSLLTFRSKGIPPATLENIHELRRLLGLDPNASEFKLVFGTSAVNDKEVAVVTRSLLQQMGIMASQVDAPAEDVSQGRAVPGWEVIQTNTNAVRLVHIRSSQSEPAEPFVAIHYRHHWFWIDDRDLKSKRVFTFMLMLFTLADTGEKENLPLVTIPAQ